MKKIISIIFLVLTISISSLALFADANKVNKEEETLLPEKPISNNYKENEKNNLFVKNNNILIRAMNDFSEGKITEKEYLKICDKVSKTIDSKSEIKKMEEDEAKFNKEVGLNEQKRLLISNLLVLIFVITQITNFTYAVDIYAGDDLTTKEIVLITKHPLYANKARQCASIASRESNTRWQNYTLTDGNGDAYRHSLLNALMTKHTSRDFAYKFGLTHEGL